jgi:uncharacterized protein (DUF58 family)
MAAGRGGGSDGISCTLAELLALRHTARSLSVKGGKPAWSIMAGSQLSRFRGRGMDYSESRIYTPGDDIRQIDWRVTARTGKLHTKLYTEERDRPILLLLDFSPSLYFGTREALKSVIAARLAATISWTAIFNSDRIGAILLSPTNRFELRPSGGRRGALRVIRALVEASRDLPRQQSEMRLQTLVQQGLRTIRPGSRIFLLSDFFALYPQLEADLARLRRHNDLVLCHLIDPLELAPPPPGLYRITDGRRRARLDTRNQEVAAAWRERFASRREQLGKVAGNLGVPRLEMVSGDDLAGVMRQGLSFSFGRATARNNGQANNSDPLASNGVGP